MLHVPIMIALLVAAPLAEASAELRDGQTIEFNVQDADTGETLYTGVERVRIRDGVVEKQTVYLDRDASEVLVERVRYELESLRVDEFTSRQPRNGEQLEVARDGDQLRVAYRASAEVGPRVEQLSWGPQTRLGKTLHHIIVRNWDALRAGSTVGFELLVPSKFDSFGFQLAARPSRDRLHVFRLEPSSWLVRQFVTPMDFYYDDAKRAVKYIGPSTVDFDDDPARRVVINFFY